MQYEGGDGQGRQERRNKGKMPCKKHGDEQEKQGVGRTTKCNTEDDGEEDMKNDDVVGDSTSSARSVQGEGKPRDDEMVEVSTINTPGLGWDSKR